MKVSFLRFFTRWFVALFVLWFFGLFFIGKSDLGTAIITGILFAVPVAIVTGFLHKWYREWRPKEVSDPALGASGKRELTYSRYRSIEVGKVVSVSVATLITFGLLIAVYATSILFILFPAIYQNEILQLIWLIGSLGAVPTYTAGLLILGFTFFSSYRIERKYNFTENMPKYRAWLIPFWTFIASLILVIVGELMNGSSAADILDTLLVTYFFYIAIFFV